MRVGDKVSLVPLTFGNGQKAMKGTVIWVHPKKRFARAMFEIHGEFGTSKLVEGFALSELHIKQRK